MLNLLNSDILSRTLTMLHESDTLDYALERSVPRLSGTIIVKRSVSGTPLIRITFSQSETVSAWRVRHPLEARPAFYPSHDDRKFYPSHDDRKAADTVVDALSVVIEELDNA